MPEPAAQVEVQQNHKLLEASIDPEAQQIIMQEPKSNMEVKHVRS